MPFDLFAISSLSSTDSGVTNTVIWVSAGEPSGADRHLGPRLWVVLGNDISPNGLTNAVSVRLTSPPEMLGTLPPEVAQVVVKFADKNRDALLRYWNAEISTREMLDLLEPVGA